MTVSSTMFPLIESALAAMDDDVIDLDQIKRNILSYSAINMAHGRLKYDPEATPSDSIPRNSDPSSAEADDRRRQLATPVTETPLADPEVVAALRKLYGSEGRFAPFDYSRNIRNALLATVALTGYKPAADRFKSAYVSALNAVQNSSLHADEAVVVSFENPQLLDQLWREGLVTPDRSCIFSPHEQAQISRRIDDAFSFIRAVDERLYDAIRLMIGTIACIRREGSSGTVSSMLGLLWLNPHPAWTIVDFAENIVHEFIHNTVFLEDLVHRIFTKPHWYAPDDALVVSAIKRYPRGINIAFHSVIVGIGLTIFMDQAHQPLRARELGSGLKDTLRALHDKAEGYLSKHAIQMLQQVDVYDQLRV